MGNDITETPVHTYEVDDSSKSDFGVGRENIHATLAPHESYEGNYRFDPQATWTPEEEAVVVRKTDFYLLSILCVMFFGLQLDRGNLSNATADDLLEDLGLTTDDYNNGSTIQLLCFLSAEFPVQFLTKKYGFKYILPSLMFCWGIVSTFQAFMTNRTGFFITRALIGLFEGGFIPGAILMATYFYTSKELAKRLAAFWSTLNVARVISALLAAGILEMRGVSSKPGWFWLFILEGILTMAIAIFSFLYLPTSPCGTRSVISPKPWYTEREEVIMINRILRDDPAKGLTNVTEPIGWKDVKAAWSDKSLWGLYFIGLIAYIPATPVQAYLTLTLKRVGSFTTLQSNLLTAPSAALQIITMLALAWSSDHFNERTFHCIFGQMWMVPLFTAILTIPDGGREWGRFSLITLIAGYPYFHPLITSWISENSFDVKKRAVAAATYNVIVQMGSVVGNQVYRSWDSPYYKTGNTICVSILALGIVAVFAQRQWLVYLNKKKENVWSQMTKQERVEYQLDQTAREIDGNKRLDFRFAY